MEPVFFSSGGRSGPLPNPRLELTDSAGNPSQSLGGKHCVHKCPLTAHPPSHLHTGMFQKHPAATEDKAAHLPVSGVSTKKKKRQIEKHLSS